MRKTGVATIIGLIMLLGCGPNQVYERTKTGLEYYFFEKNDEGKTGDKGDIYNVNITATTPSDSVIFEQQAMFQRSASVYPGDFHEGLRMLHENDSAAFVLNVDSFFTLHGLSIPHGLTGDSMFKLYIGVTSILSPYQHTIFKCEEELIDMQDFVKRKGWNVVSDSTGIMYEIMERKEGSEEIVDGDSLGLSYIYATLNDRIIERTRDNDLWGYRVGSTQTRVTGLNRLLTLMKEGDKARAVIPFTEAFGEEGAGVLIPPYTTLVIELTANKTK